MKNTENDSLRQRIAEENKNFSYEKFFGKNGIYKDYGATVLFTTEQAVTIVNGNDGRGDHDRTQEQICRAIYDLGPKRGKNREIYNELKNSMIRFRIINEGVIFDNKFIWITFPKEITKGQLQQLKAYQVKYGSAISQIGKNSSDNIIGFTTKDGKEMLLKDLQEVIAYAEKLPISKKIKFKDKFIIGDTAVKERGAILKLFDSTIRALRRGITGEECANAANKVEKDLEEDRNEGGEVSKSE